MKLRRTMMGLATVLGLAERGFFIPYRYAHALPRPGARAPYALLGEMLHEHEDEFRTLLDGMDGFAAALKDIGRDTPPEPRWNQDWFPRLDAAAAYTLVRAGRPKHIVEVGSGHSTRFLARAMRDAEIDGRITAIDPHPRTSLFGIRDLELLRAPVQDIGLQVFDSLNPGDMLFIDSSHVLMPGSDVDLLINRALPGLPSGVLVHFHDIFLPDDYPSHWGWRGYNEQLAVAALLMSKSYAPVFASHFVASRMREILGRSAVSRIIRPPGAVESSFWLRKL
ncbi:MAG: class I SAM-dependent methyltransferase [Alphaproteobacteria bacterium]|jgi:predicted O-methyltransferase YrrM|nr:class I SAM-dependent methyltransferase [Alphaproteobacteria bacterium]MDP6590514.1 class I SAM-dependent methyltransferase [Alphaproteobacteria bacterium]MDP6818623.1 class I SAM-dependent methyltransferase [Alphaproteobacteria bacterium]